MVPVKMSDHYHIQNLHALTLQIIRHRPGIFHIAGVD